MERPSPAQLLEQLANGNDHAVAEAFRAYEPLLRLIIRRQLTPQARPKFDSSDVVQSIWTDLVRGFRSGRWRFDDPTRLQAFLLKAARNRFLNRLRRNGAALRHEQSFQEGFPEGVAFSREASPDETAAADDLWERLQALCPPSHRRLLDMRRQGLSLAEMAARTGLHESSVRRIFYDLARRLAEADSNVVNEPRRVDA